ncbi:PHP domain-containing protein [soil metagenome]
MQDYKADLHMHTSYSDGRLSPYDLIYKAKKNNLQAISITDHDNISALKESMQIGKELGVEIIPGVEISSEINGQEIHILAYFINGDDEKFVSFLKKIRDSRIDRVRQMIKILNELGSKINAEEFIGRFAENISIGRPHIAMELVAEKFARNFAEAFMKYIGDNKPAYIKKVNPPYNETIKMISESGGLSFIAHPGKYVREEVMAELIRTGLDGIEIHHPSHSKSDLEYFTKIAADNFLLESGGSDFHGATKTDMQNFGKYYINHEKMLNMKRRLTLD